MSVERVLETARHGFTWVDVTAPTDPELREVAREYGLHPQAVRDCLDPEHLPKFERFPGNLFFIVRSFDAGAPADCATTQELTRKVAVFSGQGFVVSIHRGPQPFLQQVRERHAAVGATDQPELAQYFLVCDIIEGASETFTSPLDALETTIDDIEDALVVGRLGADDLVRLHTVKRRVTIVKRMLWRSLDVVQRLNPPSDVAAPRYQDLREAIESQHSWAGELVDHGTTLMNLQLAVSSERTNQVVRVLTVFSAFFLPLTFIVGVYGMNFEHMPELTSPYGYGGVWALMLVVSVGIFLWFRHRGWLRE